MIHTTISRPRMVATYAPGAVRPPPLARRRARLPSASRLDGRR